jgi:hypothetical protein
MAQQIHVEFERSPFRRDSSQFVVKLLKGGAGAQQTEPHPNARDVRIHRHVRQAE